MTLTRHNIVIAGACNSGKSSLFNAILGREAALVSPVPGTTTDPVTHLIEIPGIGSCRIIDTPGLDDNSDTLASSRKAAASSRLDSASAVILTVGVNPALEASVATQLREKGIPSVTVALPETSAPDADVTLTSLSDVSPLLARLRQLLASDATPPLLGSLVGSGDLVLLVMPQDSEAPRDRIILPQQLTIRAILDRGAAALCVQPRQLPAMLAALPSPPALVITDSQAFRSVRQAVPSQVPLTSFSILMAAWKGSLPVFLHGARVLESLRGRESRILIAQACSHVPDGEDIGTVKMPRLLTSYLGPGVSFAWCYGHTLPPDIASYSLIIQCGGCMFTRPQMLNRLSILTATSLPVTNYGLAIATALGILPGLALP